MRPLLGAACESLGCELRLPRIPEWMSIESSDLQPDRSRENVVVLPQNDLESCRQILEDNVKDVACVIMELQTSAGGCIVLDEAFVQGIRDITIELGIIMIVDETVTLRTHYNGLHGIYGVLPDLVVMGKIIGGGLPIGAVGGREELFRMGEEGQVYHSGTHHGHPLATIAGIACMEVMDEATCMVDIISTVLGLSRRTPFSVPPLSSIWQNFA